MIWFKAIFLVSVCYFICVQSIPSHIEVWGHILHDLGSHDESHHKQQVNVRSDSVGNVYIQHRHSNDDKEPSSDQEPHEHLLVGSAPALFHPKSESLNEMLQIPVDIVSDLFANIEIYASVGYFSQILRPPIRI